MQSQVIRELAEVLHVLAMETSSRSELNSGLWVTYFQKLKMLPKL